MPDLFIELLRHDDTPGTTPPPLTEDEALLLLDESEITAAQLIPWGSNYSFAVALETAAGRDQLAVYKPRAGEAPLYDFPDGTLFLREVAAYHLSKMLGWDIVPPTIVREGPHGIGSFTLSQCRSRNRGILASFGDAARWRSNDWSCSITLRTTPIGSSRTVSGTYKARSGASTTG